MAAGDSAEPGEVAAPDSGRVPEPPPPGALGGNGVNGEADSSTAAETTVVTVASVADGGPPTSPSPPPDDGKLPAQRARRAYSNVDPITFQRLPGSLLGASALVTGTTVGAGVLAMPAVTASSGWAPSSAALVGVWALAAIEALLLAETAVNTQCALGRPSAVSILSMARATLGDAGAAATSAAYALKHLSVLTAYMAQGGTILAEAASRALGGSGLVTPAVGAPIFAVTLGAALYWASDATVAAVNNALVVGTIACFGGLVATTSSHYVPGTLGAGAHWGLVIPDALPVLLVSLVYHNVVPFVVSYLEGDRFKIRVAILGGSALPLLLFVVWNAVILGNSDVQATAAVAAAADTAGPLFDPVAMLRNSGGATGGLVTGFSLLAVITSVVGVVSGMVDFVNDGFLSASVLTNEQVRRYAWAAYIVTLLPPTALAVAAPDIFFGAVRVAGVFGVSILFGILPCAMAWRLRYGGGDVLPPAYPPLVPGGRALLGAMMVGPAALVVSEVLRNVGELLHSS
ncbi:hypothetical protein MMPV_001411 [Pyropia vietnamensis]